MSKNKNDEFENVLTRSLDLLKEILKCTDACSDLNSLYYFIDDHDSSVHISAYFNDGGIKRIISEEDIYTILYDVTSCITGPRVYEFNYKEIADILNNIREEYRSQFSSKEMSAINKVIEIINDSDVKKEE